MTTDSRSPTLFGHPTGLYTLFFAEMWERFSFYGMRALLVFYMLKGFLHYGDGRAYATYGAYTALVYMTPLFGGMLADKLLGARRAVVFGGLLMAAGHLLMTVEREEFFFLALALLIVGNGFFKPNISTMVGQLYAQHSIKRDGGFTIFYMGVNLGAAISPVLCGYIGDKYGWHYGFGLAAIGMLTGLAVFVLPGGAARWLIRVGAIAAALGLVTQAQSNPLFVALNIFVGLALLAAGVVAWLAIERGGLPDSIGRPPRPEPPGGEAPGGEAPEGARREPRNVLFRSGFVYLGALLAVPLLSWLVSGFAPFTSDHKPARLLSTEYLESFTKSERPAMRALGEVIAAASNSAGLVLLAAGLVAAVYLGFKTLKLERVARQRMLVVFTLTFASMLFWSFFEQAGSSVNTFTDRNVKRVFHTAAAYVITARDVGSTLRLQPTQEQLGFSNGGRMVTLDALDALRKEHSDRKDSPDFEIAWRVDEDNVGMWVAERADEVPASIFQSVNAIYILILAMPFTALWTFLAARGIEPSTPLKFALGLLQLGLGFAAFWYGAVCADARGMVGMHWLLLGIVLQTTGELCTSPVGLSMVTRLSPRDLVSTVMGTWFLATAFSQFLAAIIAQFTRVAAPEAAAGAAAAIPPPMETLDLYSFVFGRIAIACMVSAAIFLALTPLLKAWMHEDQPPEPPA